MMLWHTKIINKVQRTLFLEYILLNLIKRAGAFAPALFCTICTCFFDFYC